MLSRRWDPRWLLLTCPSCPGEGTGPGCRTNSSSCGQEPAAHISPRSQLSHSGDTKRVSHTLEARADGPPPAHTASAPDPPASALHIPASMAKVNCLIHSRHGAGRLKLDGNPARHMQCKTSQVASPAPAWIQGAARSNLCIPLLPGKPPGHPWSLRPEQSLSTRECAQQHSHATATLLQPVEDCGTHGQMGRAAAWHGQRMTPTPMPAAHMLLWDCQQRQPKLSACSTTTPPPCHPLSAPCHQLACDPGPHGPEDGAEPLCCGGLSAHGTDGINSPRVELVGRKFVLWPAVLSSCLPHGWPWHAGLPLKATCEIDPSPSRAPSPPPTLAWLPALDHSSGVAAEWSCPPELL